MINNSIVYILLHLNTQIIYKFYDLPKYPSIYCRFLNLKRVYKD